MENKIKVYNTLSQRKEDLTPFDGKTVRMYVCGPTVYSSAHIGHARAAITFDVITRFLRKLGYKVEYARNYTDVDDKIINKSKETGIPPEEVARIYTEEYKNDMFNLGVETPTYEPKVTEHIPEIIDLIKTIIDKGYAYQSDGDVFFSIKMFRGYGKLSKRTPDEMLAGIRVDINEKKEDPLDFALWKSSKPSEPWWESPWGKGRPGWHIECSAMTMKNLGQTFDIHGGGKDLIFAHHENEIAQSEASSGKRFATYWNHNGFVNINQEKMSKSLGNFFTIREVFDKYPYSEAVTSEVLRYFLISNHYRSPVDFSDYGMTTSHAPLDGFYSMLQKVKEAVLEKTDSPDDEGVMSAIAVCRKEFVDAMNDDFNTAAAIGSLQKLRRMVNTIIEHGISREIASGILDLFKTFN